jgi:hypothetical protein
MSYPKNNPFLTVTPELLAKTEDNLRKQLSVEVRSLSLPGEGEERHIKSRLNDTQNILRKFQEFGFTEVHLIDERKFPALIEAIGPLKRAGLVDEICQILTNLLTSCGIPASALEK